MDRTSLLPQRRSPSSMADQALERVRELLQQMGYSNVSEAALLDIWNASQVDPPSSVLRVP